MNDESQKNPTTAGQQSQRIDYVTPVVRVMTEAEVLSAFQVTAAGTATWWVM